MKTPIMDALTEVFEEFPGALSHVRAFVTASEEDHRDNQPALAVQPRVMNTARVFALCADLDIAAMRLQVPWGEEVNLEEWARMHLHVVAKWALQGMVDVGIRRRS